MPLPVMKTSKPPPIETPSSSRRAQPLRQTRVNPQRSTSGLLGRTFSGGGGGRDSLGGVGVAPPLHDQPIDIFPALTHFTDAVTALPKELVRHFTLLKEVDAKIFAPEEALVQLIESALSTPVPEAAAAIASAPTRSAIEAPLSSSGSSAPPTLMLVDGVQNSTKNGKAVVNGHVPTTATGEDAGALVLSTTTPDEAARNAVLFGEANLPRRALFRQTAYKIQEMLVSLEEKNHVIATANDALARQQARIDDVWPHLELEFSAEAKWGSTTHWAYPENRAGKNGLHNGAAVGVGTGANHHHANAAGNAAGAGASERARRDGAGTNNNISAAAQQLVDEAAARSESRKQAVAAKKNLKNQNQHADSDFDDHDGVKKPGDGASKKSQGGGKSRKPAGQTAAALAAAAAAAAAAIGGETPILAPPIPASGGGAAHGPAVNGNPPAKRRKVEKPVANGAAATADRAMASVFGAGAPKPKTASPRETPAPPEGQQKKRKALPTSNGQAKKSKTGAGMSPSIASSPVMGSFADGKERPQSSQASSSTSKAPASKSKQSTSSTNTDNGRTKPSSSASNKPNGLGIVLVDGSGSKSMHDASLRDVVSHPTIKTEADSPAADGVVADKAVVTPVTSGRKELPSSKLEEKGVGGEPMQGIQTTTIAMVTTKSGRASKPSTPALATFAEAATANANARSRSNRSTESVGPNGGGVGSNASVTSSGTTTATTTVKRSHKKNANSQHVVPNTPVPLPVQGQPLQHHHHGQGQQPSHQPSQSGSGGGGQSKATPDASSAAATPVPLPRDGGANNASKTGGGGGSSKDKDRHADGGSRREDKNGERGGGGGGSGAERREDGKKKSGGGGGSGNSNQAAALAAAQRAVEEEEEIEDPDADEPTYCYCNGVSYGEMVACDADDCAREWFHLDCVGLKVAPKGNAKWYCDDCKKRLKLGGGKVNGR